MSDADRAARYSALVGRDGWLFIHNIDKMFEKHTGKASLSDEELNHWRLTLELRDRWISARGASYYFMIAPSKASIYGQFLPPGFEGAPNRPLLRLKNHLAAHPGFEIIDPSSELLALASHRQVYYQTDEHWNHFGAYCAYRQLIARIARTVSIDAVAHTRFQHREREFIGELSAVLPEPSREKATFVSIADPQARVIYENKPKGRGKVQIWENKNGSLPKAVMFRDSFANAMLPFLAESLGRVVSVSSRHVHFDLLEAEKPDVVITEMAERYLDPAPDDIRCPSFEAYCGVGLDEIRHQRGPAPESIARTA